MYRWNHRVSINNKYDLCMNIIMTFYMRIHKISSSTATLMITLHFCLEFWTEKKIGKCMIAKAFFYYFIHGILQELFEFGARGPKDVRAVFFITDYKSLRYLPSIISEPWEGCECEFAISFVKTSDTKWQHKPWFSPLKYVHIWDIRIFFNDFHLIVKVHKWLIYCNKHDK